MPLNDTLANLLPCPFCGAEPQVKRNSGDYGYIPPSIVVGCNECNVHFSEFTEKWEQGIGHYDVTEEAEIKVQHQWNRRYANTD